MNLNVLLGQKDATEWAARPGVDGTGQAAGFGRSGRSNRPARRKPTATSAADAIATVALTALTLAAVFSLSRLFLGRSFAGPIVLLVLGVHASAWLARWQGWRPVPATALSLLVLVVLVAWQVLPDSTWYGLPGLGTFHAAVRAFQHASSDFHNVTAPAPLTEGFLFVTSVSVGLLVILADWAAFRMRATLEATVPSFTLFVFCAALGGHQSRTLAVIIEVTAVLTFVVIHQATVDQESSAWFANRTSGALSSALSAGAVIGLAALIVGLNLGFRIPQANAKGVIAWRASDQRGNGTRSTLSPLVDIRGRLLNQSTEPVFTVTSNLPSYWRLTSLDQFNGTDWNALSTYQPAGRRLKAATGATTDGQMVEQDFTIQNLSEPWLPAAYEPVGFTGIKGISYDPASGSLISENQTTTGLTYHVTSVINIGRLDPSILQAAPPPPSSGPIADDLKLPSLPARVVDLARRIVAGKATQYDKALALQNYFREHFTYDVSYDYQGPDPLGHFLFDQGSKPIGFCQQFAGSYAALARVVGIPTRLAEGWTTGQQSAPDTYQVIDNQAHAWPEVYFTGIGWVPFEPTPGRGNPLAQAYTAVAPAQATPVASTPGVTSAVTTPARPSGVGDTTTRPPRPEAAAPKAHHRPVWIWVLIWSAVALAVALLIVAGFFVVRWIRRMTRRDAVVAQAADLEAPDGDGGGHHSRFARFRQAWSAEGLTPSATFVRRLKAIIGLEWLLPLLSGRDRHLPVGASVITRAEVLLTWSELVDLLSWSGVRRRPSETYRELAQRAAIELRHPLSRQPAAALALLDLAEAATKAEFGLGPLAPTEASTAATSLATVRKALLGSVSNTRRLWLAIDPRYSVKVH